jgi:serine/threonine protein kinase
VFQSGQKVGLYTLIAKLGRGGFGEVWLAEKRSQFVTKKVAVKLPHEGQINFDAIRQEATLWEQASGHPNVLPIIDADVYDNQVVIVSEYADGGSLADKLQRERKLSVKEAAEMTVGILSGLEFLHERRIIHRDIKPANILLQGKTPRLADFGISRAMQATMVSSAIIGTDAYMSPESFDGKRNAQTDIWSVGVVLYQLLKGSLPFPQDHPSERMFAVLTKEFEPLPNDLPTDLKQIVQKALAKQPEARYASAEEMREDLQKALIGIAHPTLAKTEILNKADLPDFAVNESPAQTEAMAFEKNSSNEETEIRTIVNNAPSVPPTMPAYQQNSIVTEIRQTPLTENQTVGETFDSPKPAKGTTIYEYIIAGIVALIMIFGLIALVGNLLTTDNTPAANVYAPGNVSTPLKMLTPYKQGEKWGFLDNNKKLVVPAKYEEVGAFIEDMAKVKLDGKWGFIDRTGKEIVSPTYSFVFDFNEGYAGVNNGDKGGFIDKKGNVVIPLMYDYASGFYQGLSGVQLNGKYGFIDKSGQTIVPFQYGQAFYFQNGVAVVCRDYINNNSDNCALIDKTGKELTPLKYQLIGSRGEYLRNFKLGEKWGFMDLTGKEVIPAKYYHASEFSGGYAEVMPKPGEKLFIDKNGTEFTNKPANTTKTP